MSSFKQLNKADITTVPYAANKRWNFSYISVPNDDYIVFSRGKKESFSITGSTTTNGQYQSLVYDLINHSFYQSYTDFLDTGSLMFNTTTYESASQQRPTSSYFNYNINPLFVDNFPTASNSTINVLNVNQSVFGSKILPNSFKITSSIGLVTDDGYGNLYSGSEHIGNIFYAQGIAVITNQSSSYQNLLTGSFTSTASISFQNEHIIYENEVRCIVRESDFNLSYNPSLVTGSYANGVLRNFATGSFFQPYVTTIGLYNDNNDLLMVAKLGKPIALSSDTDMTFIVRYDT